MRDDKTCSAVTVAVHIWFVVDTVMVMDVEFVIDAVMNVAVVVEVTDVDNTADDGLARRIDVDV